MPRTVAPAATSRRTVAGSGCPYLLPAPTDTAASGGLTAGIVEVGTGEAKPRTREALAVLVAQALADVEAPYGKFAIPGNHDEMCGVGRLRERLTALGFTVLENESRGGRIAGKPLAILANSEPWNNGQRPPVSPDVPPDAFRLGLTHTPDNVPWARRARCDLMLCGQNHGGQIRAPLVGSIYCPSKFGRR